MVIPPVVLVLPAALVATAVAELEGVVRLHPSHEGFWALLMLALYRDGRQADALATYQRARTWLADRAVL